MSAYMKAVAAPAAYNTAPDIEIPFEPSQIFIRPDGSSVDAYFSFDGKEDHGLLLGGTNQTQNLSMVLFIKNRKIWVRQSAGAVTVRVMAYTSA